MVDKFVQLAKSDPRVSSAFLGGSLADGTADDYSDIDLYYLVDEASYSGFHSDIRDWLKEAGQLIFFEEHSNFGFDLILFVYRNGVKGELGLGTKDNMMHLHAGPYKVLVDKKGLLDGVTFPFQGVLKGDALRKYVENSLRWYWYWYGVFLSATARGRLWSALMHLQLMMEHMFKLLVVAYNPERFPDRFERRVPIEVRDEIGEEALPQYNIQSMLTSADAMTRIIKRELRTILTLTQAEYPKDLETVVLEKRTQTAPKTLRKQVQH
jgi:hypothetical protein